MRGIRYDAAHPLRLVRWMGGAKRYPSRPAGMGDGFRFALPILRRYDIAFSRRIAPELC
jgi:hypothetical protein